MQLNVLNDLAKAKRRWTEKKDGNAELMRFVAGTSGLFHF